MKKTKSKETMPYRIRKTLIKQVRKEAEIDKRTVQAELDVVVDSGLKTVRAARR